MAPAAISGATPIAASTCDFATLPEEQAEPEETAMPSRSKRHEQRLGAACPASAKQVVLGRRSSVPAEDHGIFKLLIQDGRATL